MCKQSDKTYINDDFSQFQYFQLLKDRYQNTYKSELWLMAQLSSKPPIVINQKDFSRSFLNALLPLLEVNEALSPHVELLPLYDGLQKLNPNYSRHDEVFRMLDKCLGLSDLQQEHLLESILLVLELIKSTDFNPELFKSKESLKIWWRIFPAGSVWSVLKWLRQEGITIPSSRLAYQSWIRFTKTKVGQQKVDGVEESINEAEEWIELCESQTVFDSAFEADRMAAAFAGEAKYLETDGVCTQNPNCDLCELKAECCWNNDEKVLEDLSLQEKISKKQISDGQIPELLTWLLSKNEEEKKAFEKAINLKSPLKDWSKDRLSQLEKALPLESELVLRLQGLRKLCGFYAMEKLLPQTQYKCSRDIFLHFHEMMKNQKQEQFLIVLLDNKHRYLTQEDVTKGILNKSLVHPREVFASAIENRAAALICVHNHPSGDPEPSPEDLKITQRLVEVGKLVGIPVLDHIVLGDDRYVSFADKGLL